MKKTVVLLAVLFALGGLLLIGGRWMAPTPNESSSGGLAPELTEAPDERLDEKPRVVAPARESNGEPVDELTAPAPAPPTLPHFLARGVTGRVIDSAGIPIASAGVTLRLNLELRRATRSWTFSDRSGVYSFGIDLAELAGAEAERRTQVIEWLERSARDEDSPDAQRWNNLSLRQRREVLSGLQQPLVLEVSTWVPDHGRATRKLFLGLDPPALVHLDLIVETRPAIRGYVLDRHWGLRNVDVVLLDDDWQVVGTTRTDTSSYFEFVEPEPALHRLHARREGRGAAVRSGYHLDPGFGTAAVEIELEGAATLRGRLVMPSGESVGGIGVIGILESLVSADPERGGWADPGALARVEEAGGLAHARAVTDEKGRFEMEAMQEGRYALHFEGLAKRFQPEGFITTGAEQEILFTARLLQVLVFAPNVVAMRTRAHCEEVTALEPLPGTRRRHFVRTIDHGLARFVVESGTTWRVWVEYLDHVSVERLVDIGDGSYLEEVTFELDGTESEADPLAVGPPRPENPANLVVDLADEEGHRHPLAVTLWRVDTHGRTHLYEWLAREVDQPLPPLEAGDYEVTARAVGEAGETLLPVTGAETVRLRAGEERRVRFEAKRGGRLALRLSTGEPKSEGGAGSPVQARLVPEGDGGEPIPLLFHAESPTGRPTATVVPGGTTTCEPALPAGQYTLQLLSDGFRAERIPVAIESGETTVLDVVLSRLDSDEE